MTRKVELELTDEQYEALKTVLKEHEIAKVVKHPRKMERVPSGGNRLTPTISRKRIRGSGRVIRVKKKEVNE